MVAERRVRIYSDCMATVITVRNVPADVRDELAARARRSGRSLQEYLLAHLTDLVALPEPAALMEEVQVRKAALGTVLPSDRIVALLDEVRS